MAFTAKRKTLVIDGEVIAPNTTPEAAGAIPLSEKGAPGGVATLDENGCISAAQNTLVAHTHTLEELGAAPMFVKGTESLEDGVTPLAANVLYIKYKAVT